MNTGNVAARRNAGAVRACVLSAFVWFCAAASYAGIIMESPETWISSGLQGWTNTMSDVTLANPGGASGFLLISFPDAGDPPVGTPDDTIYTFSSPATNMFTGNYIASNAAGARFSFSNTAGWTASLRFGVATNLNEWSFTLTLPASGQWSDYDVPFRWGAGWADGGTEAEFLADLAAVEWIGIHIDRGDTGEAYFGLDNFRLYVPEPEDFCLLAAGLCGLMLAFRKKLRAREWSLGTPA